MIFNGGYVVCFAGFVIMAGHIGVLPYLFFGTERIQSTDAIDIAFLVAPLTASSFVATIRFAIDNRSVNIFDSANKVNGFFVLASVAAVVPFMVAIYVLIWAYDRGGASFEIEFVKRGIGVIEIFFGGAFGLFVSSIYGSTKAT